MMNEKTMKPYVIGLDLGSTNSVFGIVDVRGDFNFVVNLLGGILHTATSQRNLPYEYRPLICQMTDSLLYSKAYSSNSRYINF